MEPRIHTIYEEHKGRYGYRRMTAALCISMAEPVNHKCVQRLMQKMGLRAVIRAKKRYCGADRSLGPRLALQDATLSSDAWAAWSQAKHEPQGELL